MTYATVEAKKMRLEEMRSPVKVISSTAPVALYLIPARA